MRSAAHEQVRSHARWHHHGIRALVVALALGAGFAIWSRSERAEVRGLHRMAPADWSELFQETERYVDTLCARAESEETLRGRCTDAAEFLQTFPECDDACRTHVPSRLHQPAR